MLYNSTEKMLKLIDLRDGRENPLLEKLLSRTQVDTGDIAHRVEEIISSVKKGGDKALLEYTKKFDRLDITPENIRITRADIDEAYGMVSRELIEVIRLAVLKIHDFHSKQKQNSWISAGEDGVILGQLIRPLEVVGVYVPGGTAAYPSSVLMNVIPAKVAEVKRVVMVTPPKEKGKMNPAILVAAREAGVDEIYRVGGAQAVAALAFGTGLIPRVDKIVGPGNIYVATAKRMVYGYCDIDMIAGPSEILVIADGSANPVYVAADLLSQAEHDELASAVLVTDSYELAAKVREEVDRQSAYLHRRAIIEKSIESYGAAIIVNNIDEAVDLANRIAPEHLELCVTEPFSLLGSIKNAGAVFLGNYAPEPLGDYLAGPNHVLPTSGTARFFSPLNVGDFIKKSSVISYTREALEGVSRQVELFAESEGLSAHANAIRVRVDKSGEWRAES